MEERWHADAEATTSRAVAPLALGVRGYACEIFDDEAVAWRLHCEDHLMAWQGDAALRVDRYDARNLLADRSAFRRLKRAPVDAIGSDCGVSQEAHDTLQELRYGDLRKPQDAPAADCEGPEQAEDAAEAPAETAPTEQLFERPEGVPAQLQVPRTVQEQSVIAMTAAKTRGNAALEIMMKTRLASQPSFGFLQTSHALHGYYLFLRDERPAQSAAPVVNGDKGGARLLGAEYEDSEEEIDGPPSATQERKTRDGTDDSTHDLPQEGICRRSRSPSHRRRRSSSRSRPRANDSARRHRERSRSHERSSGSRRRSVRSRSRSRSRSRDRRRRRW